MALKPQVKEEIIRLLKEGKVSKKEIHRLTKVSRPTIDKIEKSLLFPEEVKPPKPKQPKIEYARCKGCGGKQLVGIPCLVCSIHNELDKSYDKYMEELLGSPVPVSPLSSKVKGASNG